MTIGEIILQHCEKRGCSLTSFANDCGLSKGYISMLVNGANPKTGKPLKPQIDSYYKLVDGLGMTLNDLFEIMDDAPISINEPTTIPSEKRVDFSDEEWELVNIYRELNTTGRAALIGAARGLRGNPDMKKGGALNDGEISIS